ncbi:hypothetical protein TIFTF001_012225 [Ficus carica]|uniref:Uncharacterized protein n=1 Tax=Ficus carica TaxID=3494 RepID=A0AA88ABX7_FICCA|nr:hypothetical protein TIFTF001_012225 [Ficus carica]
MEVEYSKVLRQNDIQYLLTVPQYWMNILRPQFGKGENEALIRAFSLLGYVWEFRCAIRGNGPHEMPVLRAPEWQRYINYIGIQEGDRFTLEAEENDERRTNYNVRVQRMDADGLWADVQPPARVAPAFYHFKI